MNLNIAENIKRLRIENNLTQAELADDLSVSPQAVSRWEKGQAYPDIELLAKVADYFNVTVDELMGRKEVAANSLAKKYQNLYAQYYHEGAKDKNMLMQLCDMLEKLCELEPQKYVAAYFKLSKKLFEITYNDHLSNARKVALSLMPSIGAQRMNSLLLNIVIHEDESELDNWKRYIANHITNSTWNDLLLSRYSVIHDRDNWEKIRQEIVFTNIEKSLYSLVMGIPSEEKKEGTFIPPDATPSEHCKLALHTLSLYSNDPFDIFFIVRMHIEIRLTIAYFKEGNLEAGFDHLAVLKEYAVMLRQMIDEKAIRRGSVPMLSLVEREAKEFEESTIEEILLYYNNSSLFDEVRNDERLITTIQEFQSLFHEHAGESRLNKRIACVDKLLAEVLDSAIKELPEETQEILREHFNQSVNGSCNTQLQKIELFRNPQKNNLPKAKIKDFIKFVNVKMTNKKNNLTFKVTVKNGYLRSIISSECEDELPFHITKYEIVPSFSATHSSYVPEDWAFADGIIKKPYHKPIGTTNQEVLIVMLSAKEKIYTVHFSTINEGVDVDLLDTNLKSLIADMKSNDDTEIKRLVCFRAGYIDLPSYAFRDKLCKLNCANLNTQLLFYGAERDTPEDICLMTKPLSATMAKGYKESFSSPKE